MMRRLILAALLVGCTTFVGARAWIAQVPAAAVGGFALVNSTFARGAGSAVLTSASTNMTGANLCVIGMTRYVPSNTIVTPTDSQSNVYTQIGTEATTAGSPDAVSLWYVSAPSVSSTMTFMLDLLTPSQAAYATIAVECWSGAAASLPLGPVAQASTANQAGSVTASQANDLYVARYVAVDTDTGAPSINSSFVTSYSSAIVGGSYIGGGMAHLVQSGGPAALNPLWSTTGGGTGASAIATFKHP